MQPNNQTDKPANAIVWIGKMHLLTEAQKEALMREKIQTDELIDKFGWPEPSTPSTDR